MGTGWTSEGSFNPLKLFAKCYTGCEYGRYSGVLVFYQIFNWDHDT